MEVLSDPAGISPLSPLTSSPSSLRFLAGSPEDKLRLFLIHYLCSPAMTQVSDLLSSI